MTLSFRAQPRNLFLFVIARSTATKQSQKIIINQLTVCPQNKRQSLFSHRRHACPACPEFIEGSLPKGLPCLSRVYRGELAEGATLSAIPPVILSVPFVIPSKPLALSAVEGAVEESIKTTSQSDSFLFGHR